MVQSQTNRNVPDMPAAFFWIFNEPGNFVAACDENITRDVLAIRPSEAYINIITDKDLSGVSG
jgi:hypothetical protein